MNDVDPKEFASLAADVRHLATTLGDFIRRVEPLLTERSGDLATLTRLQRDVDSSHEKSRNCERKNADLERRVDRMEDDIKDNAKLTNTLSQTIIELNNAVQKLNRQLDRARYWLLGALIGGGVLGGGAGVWLQRILAN